MTPEEVNRAKMKRAIIEAEKESVRLEAQRRRDEIIMEYNNVHKYQR
jgi:hypothetical protein